MEKEKIYWDNYLKRIKYKGNQLATIENLRHLQESHQLHVPFENLDIHYGIEIILDVPSIYNKVVEKRRGGFCYELNGLFYELLKYMGYQVTMISARVHSRKNGYGKEYDHLAIIVSLDGMNYVTDVGYGEFAFHPLAITKNIIQEDQRGKFIIDDYDENYIRIKKIEGDGFNPEYIFTSKERKFHEFEEMCRYQQTSPNAHFTQKKMISRPTPDGRITLTSDQLKIRKGDSIVETAITDEATFNDLLDQYFNISVNK